jgi:predicted PurR-regulated permease PerM
VDEPATNRGLLRAALALVLFGLFLVWYSLVGIVTAALVLLVGLLLAVALSGPVEWLHRHKVPRPLASIAIVSGILGALALAGYLFLPVLAEHVWQVVSSLPFAFSQLDEWAERAANSAGLSIGYVPSTSTLSSWTRGILGGTLGLFESLTTLVFGMVVAIFVPLYLTANPEPVVRWILRVLPPKRRPRAREVLSKMRHGLLNWLKGRLLSMTAVGVLWSGVLYLIGIPGALLLGILAGLLEFVPYVGPIVSTVPPVLLALAGEPVDALWVVISYLVIQQVEGYLLTPLIEGKITSLHPAAMIAAITVAGAAFGFLGVFLAVPVAVVLKILVEEVWFRRVEGGYRADP